MTKNANAKDWGIEAVGGRRYSDPANIPADSTPDAFSFTDQIDVEFSTTITSAPVTITGIGEVVTFSVTGGTGTIDVNSDGNFQTSRNVSNGDTIRAQHTSSASATTAVNTVVTGGGVSDTFTSTTEAIPVVPGDGQLDAGHWYSSVGTFFSGLYAVYPRPDAETSTYARHRKAYYDGTNPIQYEVKLGVQFGGWPYWYELIDGPSGMTVGELYGDADYGCVRWTPSGDVTNDTVTVRVHDQDGNSLDVTWTVSTSSSTADFMFVSPTGNDTTGTGSISAPFLTLSKLFGATEGTTTYPNRIVYMRAGTYAAYTQGSYGFRMYQGRTPTALIGYPGESVEIDMGTAGSICTINFSTGAHDLFFKNITFIDHPTSTNYYAIRGGELQHRITFDDLHFPDAYRGSAADNNSSSIYFNSSGSGYRNHIFLTDCSETNRGVTGGGGNSWGLTCQFTTNRVLVQYCTDTGNTQQRGCYMKASNANVELRELFHKFSSGGPVILTGLQVDGGLDQGPFLYRHNKLAASSTSGYALAADESQAASGGTRIKQHYFVRNSCYGRISMNGPATGTHGPYVVAENVINAANNSIQRNYANNTLGNYVTSTDNVGGTSGWLNATTIELEAAHLDVLGTRGAQVA
jgi:hypothetical protein